MSDAARDARRGATAASQPMELCGYTDLLSVCPGEELSVMVSASCDRFRARLVRLIHGDENPNGPGYKAIPIPSEIEGSYQGVAQPLVIGSHLAVERLACPDAFTVAVWVWPSLLGEDERGLLGHAALDAGMAMTLDADGRLGFWLAGKEVARTAAVARRRRWHLAIATYDPVAGVAIAGLGLLGGEMTFSERSVAAPPDSGLGVELPFWIGAWCGAGHFNGKLEDPVVFQAPLSPGDSELLQEDARRPEQLGQFLLAGISRSRFPHSRFPISRVAVMTGGSSIAPPARSLAEDGMGSRSISGRHRRNTVPCISTTTTSTTPPGRPV